MLPWGFRGLWARTTAQPLEARLPYETLHTDPCDPALFAFLASAPCFPNPQLSAHTLLPHPHAHSFYPGTCCCYLLWGKGPCWPWVPQNLLNALDKSLLAALLLLPG